MDVVDVRHTYQVLQRPEEGMVPRKDVLELQEVVEYSARILGTKLCSSGRAEGTLTQCVAQVGPQRIFLLLPLQHILLPIFTSDS